MRGELIDRLVLSDRFGAGRSKSRKTEFVCCRHPAVNNVVGFLRHVSQAVIEVQTRLLRQRGRHLTPDAGKDRCASRRFVGKGRRGFQDHGRPPQRVRTESLLL